MLGSLSAQQLQLLIFTTLFWLPRHSIHDCFYWIVLQSGRRAIREHTNEHHNIYCMLDDDVAFKCNVIKLGWKPADLFAGGCGRSTVAQRSSLSWFKLNGRACQGCCGADTCFNFVLWCLGKRGEERENRGEETDWVNRVPHQKKKQNRLSRKNGSMNSLHAKNNKLHMYWNPVQGRGGSEWLMRSFSHRSGFSVNVSDSFIQYAVCKCNNPSVGPDSDLLTKTTTNQLMRGAHFRWRLLLWLIKHATTAPQPPTAISIPFWKFKPIKWLRSNNQALKLHIMIWQSAVGGHPKCGHYGRLAYSLGPPHANDGKITCSKLFPGFGFTNK